MRGRAVVPVALALGGCLVLGGCFTLDTSLPAGRATPARPAAAPPSDHKDLRIPDGQLVGHADIPLVPVPPPPGAENPPATRLAASTAPAPAPPSPVASSPAPAAAPVEAVRSPESAPTPPAAPGPLTARQLIDRAAARYDGMDSYIARLTRHEVLNGTSKPNEVLTFKFRKEPWSVYFKWLSKDGEGREALYVKGQYEGKIHTLLAAGDVLFLPAGKRMAISPDSPLVRSASRQPLTQAGLGAGLDRLVALIKAQEAGDRRAGVLTAVGPVRRPEFRAPLDGVEHVIPAGAEPLLPRGGKRLYGFDPETHLPLLVVLHDDKGQEVEYYCYDRLQFPVHLDNDDFNPDKLWAPKPSNTATAGR